MPSVDETSFQTRQGVIHSERFTTGAVGWKALQLPPVAKVDRIVELSLSEDVPFIGERAITQLLFAVTDQDSKPVDIGKVLLELYIM